MASVCFALGANIGDRLASLQGALDALRPYVRFSAVSSVYETDPAYALDQPLFLNAACRGETELDPRALLFTVKDIERSLGRVPSYHYGPRALDIDILFYDDLVLHERDLTIPHALMQERLFVLQPLADIAPDWVHPVSKKTVRELRAALSHEDGVRPFAQKLVLPT